MRINFFIPGIYFGGAEKQLLFLANDLRYFDCEVRIITFYARGYSELIRELNVNIKYLQFNGFRSVKSIVSFFRFIRDLEKDDVVVSFLPVADILAGIGRVLFKFRWFVFERNSFYYNDVFSRIRQFLVNSYSLSLFCNSEAGLDYWSTRGKFGILLRNSYEDAWQKSKSFSYIDRDIDYLYVGRVEEPQKNIEKLLELFEWKAQLGYKCLVIGKVEDIRYQEMLRNSSVGYKEFTEDIFIYLKRAKVFVSLSRYEGSPNTVVEAAFCGCSLVLSDIPEHRWLNLPKVSYYSEGIDLTLNHLEAISPSEIETWYNNFKLRRSYELKVFLNELYNRS